jgi:hypothetical protein
MAKTLACCVVVLLAAAAPAGPVAARSSHFVSPVRVLRNANIFVDVQARAADSARQRLQYGKLGKISSLAVLAATPVNASWLQSMGFLKSSLRHTQALMLIRTRTAQTNGETWNGYYVYDVVTHLIAYEQERYVFPAGARIIKRAHG